MSWTHVTTGIVFMTVGLSSIAESNQRVGRRPSNAEIEVVAAVGCVEQRVSNEASWWLIRATEPSVTRAGVFNEVQIEDARESQSGENEFQLIGVADFLTAEGLLRYGERAAFTTPEQINATGELREGRTVLVKGLLIESDESSRINLLAVVGLSDTCS